MITQAQYIEMQLKGKRPKIVVFHEPAKVSKRRGSKLEGSFEWLWNLVGGPLLVREWRFDKERRWRFDFAHLGSKTAIEIEGGVWGKSRHTTGKGFEGDCEKYNAATMNGWRVIRLTNRMINTKTLLEINRFIARTS